MRTLMAFNPYEAPRAEVSDFEPAEQQLATRLQRFGDLVIDTLAFIVVMALVLIVGEFLSPTFAETVAGDNLLVIVLMTVFYILFEFFLERTPGKLLTGTRVVTETGGAPGLQQCVVRSVVRLVPFEPLSFFGAPPLGWHDRWSRTRVIRTRRKPTLDRMYDLRHADRTSRGAWQPEPERYS